MLKNKELKKFIMSGNKKIIYVRTKRIITNYHKILIYYVKD